MPLKKKKVYVIFVVESFNIHQCTDLLSGHKEQFIFPDSLVIGQDWVTSPCQWIIDGSDMSYSVAAIVKVL